MKSMNLAHAALALLSLAAVSHAAEPTRANVTDEQAAPNRIRADSLWVARVGTGYMVGSDLGEVPISLGGGYRFELDAFAVEAGLDLTVALGGESEATAGVHFGGFVGGLYFFDGVANSSPYVGAGLGYGLAGLANEDEAFGGAGLEARLSAGYAMLRASTIRLVVELNATVPFYTLEEAEVEGASDETRYAPVFGLNVGVGYEP